MAILLNGFGWRYILKLIIGVDLMEKKLSEVEFKIMKLITENPELLSNFQWPSEQERWKELIFALITSISNKPENEVRVTIEKLNTLGLLDVKMLADTGLDSNFNQKRIMEILLESGFGEEESMNYLLVMQEAAQSLNKTHDGKIQKYIRFYGQKMIDEINQNFSFTNINDKNVKNAFTYWLQNVLNVPIILKSESLDQFCQISQITEEELLNEADKMDLSLILLDDLIVQHMQNLNNQK